MEGSPHPFPPSFDLTFSLVFSPFLALSLSPRGRTCSCGGGRATTLRRRSCGAFDNKTVKYLTSIQILDQWSNVGHQSNI